MQSDITIKQKRFVNEYLRNGGNGTQAARSAGYSGDDNALAVQSNRLLRNAKVVDALSKYTEGTNLKERTLKAVQDMALEDTGEPVSNVQKLRALEMLCKIIGLYEEGTRPSVQVNLQQINVRDMSEEELLRTLSHLKKEKALHGASNNEYSE